MNTQTLVIDMPAQPPVQEAASISREDYQAKLHMLQIELVKPQRHFTGCDEAALVATSRDRESVTLKDFAVAVEPIVAGLEKKSRILNPMERRTVAFHEMGHALVAMMLPGADPVHKVSIIPRGIGALGYTIQRPTEDRFLMRSEELEDKMAVLLGGRAAEQLVFGHVSTGAADDLAKVSDIARAVVTRYGMHESLANLSLEQSAKLLLERETLVEADLSSIASQVAPARQDTEVESAT